MPIGSFSACMEEDDNPRSHWNSPTTSDLLEGRVWHTVAVTKLQKMMAVQAKEPACCLKKMMKLLHLCLWHQLWEQPLPKDH